MARRGATPSDWGTDQADAELAAFVSRASQGSLERMPALSAFMRRMENRPQLSPDAQGELVALYQRSLVAEQDLENGRLKGASRRDAEALVGRGRRALDDVVASNFRLLLLISREQATKRYPSRDRLAEVLPDLVNEGNIAIVEAAKTFDPALSPTFPSFAARKIRDHVRAILSRQTPVHMSPAWTRTYRIARHAIPELTTDLGRPPTTEELQAELTRVCMVWAEGRLTDAQRELPADRREKLMTDKLRKQGMLGAIQRIDKILLIGQTMSSLDAPVGDGSASLSDLVANPVSDDLFSGVEHEELASAIRSALAELDDRERTIILHRYGFIDGESWTYDRISKMYDVSAERIRQIEKAVLSKMRSPHAQYANLAAFLPSQFEG